MANRDWPGVGGAAIGVATYAAHLKLCRRPFSRFNWVVSRLLCPVLYGGSLRRGIGRRVEARVVWSLAGKVRLKQLVVVES